VEPAARQFQVRTLAVHEFRRILLRDPLLPAAMLPRDWPGTAAREVFAAVYRESRAGVDAFVGEALQTALGPLPPPAAWYDERFAMRAPSPGCARGGVRR
jgi:phenylacetic acid degradation operon negative regulatory protein